MVHLLSKQVPVIKQERQREKREMKKINVIVLS